MSKAFTTGLAALAACTLFACAGGGMVTDSSSEPSTETNGNEPTLFTGDNGGAAAQDPNATNDGRDRAIANGAVARSITFNHPTPHELVIPATDMISGKDGTFALTNGGGAFGVMHSHEVTLTARQLAQIADGASLTVETTPGGAGGAHTHTVTIAKR